MPWLLTGALVSWGMVGSVAPGHAQSAGVVAGEVRDEGGAALSHAQVVVLGTERVAVTDADGRFLVRGLGMGRHHLEATAVGYAPAVEEVVVIPGGRADVVFRLRPTPLALPGLVVTGAATAGAALDLARAASQLTGRTLEREMGSSVAETLAGQPGLSVRYNGPGAAAPVVRGLTGDRVVVMRNGHRTADLAGSAEDHLVTVDPLSAQRIEVIRGPAALLYGSNALGGVVNVLTGDLSSHALARPEITGALQVQSAYPGATAHARAAVPLGEEWSWTAYASGRDMGDVRIGRENRPGGVDARRLANTALRSGGGGVSIGYAGRTIYGGVTVRGFGFAYGVPVAPGDDAPIRIDGHHLAVSTRWEASLGSALFAALRVSASASDYAHDELEDDAVVPAMAFAVRTGRLDLQLRQAARGPFQEGAWGLALSQREYAATGADQLTPPAGSSALGAFTYQQLTVGEETTLQLGGRVDRHVIASRGGLTFGPGTTRAFSTLSGSLGVGRSIAPGVTAAISVARSFRAPTVEELFSDGPHAGTASYEIGDPSLSPEIMTGVDLVARARATRWHVEAAAYASRITSYIALAPRGDTILDGIDWPVLAYTQTRASMYGAEASVDWLAGGDIVLGARGDLVLGTLPDGDAIPFLPPARLAVSTRWEPGRLSAGVTVRHAAARKHVSGGADVPTDAYTLIRLDAGLRIDRGRIGHALTLRVDNATDRAYRDAASRIKRFAPNPGRNVSLLYRVYF